MAGFQFTKATKSQAKARIAITGPAGSGKTWTALLLATAICKRVAVIDTEHGSASKYADTFAFDTLELDDFHPENYIGAIRAAEQAGYDGLVIDSASHEWSGKGGCLELVETYAVRNKGGNKFAAWGDVTPLHNAFIEAIHQCNMHVFTTYRSKMDYVQTEGSNGKTKIERVGMAPVTREGGEYEHDIVLDMDQKHNGVITKTRYAALDGKVYNKPGEDLAKAIMAWLTDGAPAAPKPQQAPHPAPQPKPAAQPAQQPAASQPKPTNGNGQPRRTIAQEWEYRWDKANALDIPADVRPTMNPNGTREEKVAAINKLGELIKQYEAGIPGGGNGHS